MSTRFKMIVAALGLVFATGAIADASAATIVKTVKTRGIVAHETTKVVTHRPRRVIVGGRIVRHVRIVHRAPLVVRKVVRVTKRPLWSHVVARRVVTKTIVR